MSEHMWDMTNLAAEVLAEFAAAAQLGSDPLRWPDREPAPRQMCHESVAGQLLRRRAREALAAWGVPCVVCGEPVHSRAGCKRRLYCSSRCRHRAYRERHPSRSAAAAARYRERLGAEVVNERARERYRENREKVCAQVRERYRRGR